MSAHWGRVVLLGEIPLRLVLEPDADERAQSARKLGLKSLPALRAELDLRPWLDGVEIAGRFTARVEQVCGVTLEDFEQDLAGELEVRAVPPGSPNAADEAQGELMLDPEAPDPPDVLEGDGIDPTAYLIEQLALDLDPFPRKPGASFDFEPEPENESPFAVLKRLQERDP